MQNMLERECNTYHLAHASEVEVIIMHDSEKTMLSLNLIDLYILRMFHDCFRVIICHLIIMHNFFPGANKYMKFTMF